MDDTTATKSATPSREWVRVRCPTVQVSTNDVILKIQLAGRVIAFSTGLLVRLKPLPSRLRGLSTSGIQAATTAAG